MKMKLNKLYQYKTTPIAAKEAIVAGEKYRFTILTSRLIRIEYSETGCFEDRAPQTVINREFDVPKFDVQESNGILTIITEHIELTYDMENLSCPHHLKFAIQARIRELWQAGFRLYGVMELALVRIWPELHEPLIV